VIRRALLFLVIVLAACSREDPTPEVSGKPSVILISIDTLRADRLPLYGYQKLKTPAIDALARDGVVFEHAWSHCPMTLPSHVSMLTGLLPTTNEVRNNVGFRYDPTKFPALPQLLKANGYATGAAVSSYVIRGETGLATVFDWYDDSVEARTGASAVEQERTGAATAAVAEQWLQSVKGPFFLMLHLYEPHAPYNPPEPFRSQTSSLYDGEVAAADAVVGSFIGKLKERGIYDDAILIVTSDHGEGLGDHGEQQHSTLLYRETLNVPLIIKLPRNARAGKRIAGNAALIDLVPTIRALTGIAGGPPAEGVDLFKGPLPDREIYSETIYPWIQLGWSDLRSMVWNSFHYIQSPRPELYDMSKDPGEKRNMIAEERRVAARLRTSVERFPPPSPGNEAVDPETAAKLAALGYVGSVRSTPQGQPLPNPVDRIAEVEAIRDVYLLADRGKYQEAIAGMRAIVEKNPRFIDVWVRLAQTYQTVGRPAEAIEAYKQAIGAAGPTLSSDLLVSLGFLYLQTDQLSDAQNTAEAALKASPDRARELLVRIAGTRGDLATAERTARELAARPTATGANHLLLAEVLLARNDYEGALQFIGSAAQRAPGGLFGLESLRGEVLMAQRRPLDAIRAFEAEIARFPHNGPAYARLAMAYAAVGDRAAAERTLNRLVEANPTPPARSLADRTRRALR
jgi:arylsulfatase A-like enzyme/tetratricopeptide (TPR) repeat protein